MQKTLKHIRRIAIGVIGGTVVLIGIALLVLPGPGIVVIIVGLALLATEFEIAKIWLQKAKDKYNQGKDRVLNKKN